MATKPKAVLSTHDGREASPITKASNVLFENGQTAQDILNDRQDAMISPVIENSSSMFKVGQGDNVDYSSNVVNGAYESMVLKGRSLVNCIQEPSSQDVVLPYEFADGQYVTINDTKESGALGVELKGQTLVNIHDKKTPSLAAAENDWYSNLVIETNSISFTVAKLPENWRYISFKSLNLSMLKPNTKYLVAFEEASGVSTVTFKNGDSTHPLSDTVQIVSNKAIVTTTSDWVNSAQILYIYVPAKNVGAEVKVKNPMIIEYVEGMENWDIPYFEGMTSCKMPILRTTGKNLFDYSSHPITLEKLAYSDGQQVHWTGYIGVKTYVPVKENTTYTYSNDINVGIHFGLVFYDDDKSVLSYINNFKTNNSFTSFTTPKGCKFIRFAMETQTIPQWIQLEEATSPTSYESYKSSILSLPEEVVLRSLPNGVRDTFNTRTGVYTQRVYETTITGTGDWVQYDTSNTNRQETIAFSVNLGLGDVFDNDKTYSKLGGIVCDKLNHINSVWGGDKDIEGISADQRNVIVQIKKTRLASEDIAGFKTWLTSNNLKVGIQLKTPTVTKINLPSTLKSWNTTTHIYSEIPENSLYPTLSHSNPTYPVILKPSTKYSIVANSYSNDHTNSAINFNLGGATATTTVGNRVTTITTLSTLSNELLTMSGRGNKLNNVMVVEGDVVGDEPYFEGICDCKSPILSNVGKNLFDVNQTPSYVAKNTTYSIVNNEITINSTGATNYPRIIYTLDKKLLGKTIFVSYDVVKNTSNNWILQLVYTKIDGVTDYRNCRAGIPITLPNEITGDLTIGIYADNTSATGTAHTLILKNIQIEEGSATTPYEPYKSNILSCETYFDETSQSDKTIVLRSLPNGVCDTLNVETGEYIKRIGKVVLNGSQTIETWWNTTSTVGVRVNIPTMKNISNMICDRLPVKYYRDINNNTYDTEGIASWDVGNSVYFRILKSKLETEDINGVKKYLAINPVTVQYELEVPIVETVDLSGFPFSYENGHVILSSGSIEQSLTPKVEYSVATNRNGQIRSNQKMVERHQKQLDQLQAIILANLVNSQYNQTLTTLKYELSRV